MSNVLHKKSILQKTAQMGGLTFLSRMMGLVREIVQVRYMGAKEISDAFRSAYQVPNLLRQIFAEGALSAAMVPNIVKMVKDGEKERVSHLMTLSFLVFEGVLLAVIGLVCWKAEFVIHALTPGYAPYQAALAARLLRILMSFIFFISSSALLAGALQAVHQFWVPAVSPVLLNVVFISGLSLGIVWGLSIETFCFFVLFGGLLQFLLHLYVYVKAGFYFSAIDRNSVKNFSNVLKKFLPTMISGSVVQTSLLVDNYFASYLPAGSISLLGISQGFLRIPLGIVVSFSTVLLTHFSRVGLSAPKRLSFYLLESTKLIVWLTLPITLMMGFFSEKVFYTFFYSKNFSLAQVAEARLILSALLLGLFFFSINKILLSLYYSLHQMWIPASITIAATLVNIALCSWWVSTFRATGLAVAMIMSQAFQTIIFVVILHKKFNFRLYHLNFLAFLLRYIFQVCVTLSAFFLTYFGALKIISLFPRSVARVLTMTIGIWVWVVPLMAATMLVLYKTRAAFGVRLYFLKK